MGTISMEMIGPKERCVAAYRDGWLKREVGGIVNEMGSNLDISKKSVNRRYQILSIKMEKYLE